MNRVALDLWSQALKVIQQELPSQAYETWFQTTRAVEVTDQSIVIEVPSPFFRDWLASHYATLIKKVFSALGHEGLEVEYRIAPISPDPVETAARSMKVAKTDGAAQTTQTRPATSGMPLNPRYTFDQFVIGPSNRFAHAASQAVADSPAKVYNPLFIYGGVGLGKTHLMQGIGHQLQEGTLGSKCIYISSEQFTNLLISAIQNRSMEAFRNRFRSADVLLIDDIHFLGGKEATQEAFFHTFNALHDAHSQIVLSSDRPPKEIRGVEERLISRFEWGLVTDIQPPDLETRVAILRKKAEAQSVFVDDAVTLYVAERISSNIRELEGALNRVIASAVLTNRKITLGMAEEVLRGMVAESARMVTLDRIQQAVADHFSLSVSDLRGRRRTQAVSLPRQIAMALARELTEASLPAIGEAFGGRDHATVLYACHKIEKSRKSGDRLGRIVEELARGLK